METTKPSFGVLDGMKVVFSAMEIAGPTAAAIMGEWGADVTWLENHWNGDSMRDTKWVKEMERRNMRSVSLNQFSEAGKEVLLALIKDADIFIESSKGPVFARKGLTDEVLWEVNPKLVIVHVSGYGQSGETERINTAAYDLTVAAYSGMLSQNGFPQQPVGMHPYTADYINSLMIISASLAAVHKARQSGLGESIDLAMHETLLRVGTYYMLDYLNDGVKYPRPGGGHQNLCGIGEYKCKDGFIALCIYGAPQNKYLLETIGLGHLWGSADIPEGTTALWKSNPQAELIEEKLTEYLATQSRHDVARDFSAHKMAAQEINEFEDVMADAHIKARDTFIEWENADGQKVIGLNTFPKFARNPGAFWRPMPKFGQDTRAELAKAGFTDEQIAQLIADGIVKAAQER